MDSDHRSKKNANPTGPQHCCKKGNKYYVALLFGSLGTFSRLFSNLDIGNLFCFCMQQRFHFGGLKRNRHIKKIVISIKIFDILLYCISQHYRNLSFFWAFYITKTFLNIPSDFSLLKLNELNP